MSRTKRPGTSPQGGSGGSTPAPAGPGEPRPSGARGRSLALVAGAVVFLVDLAALAPDVHVHDAGELMGSGWFLGISHPPGVPFYELLLKLFLTFVPIGGLAVRANLFSALCAGAATTVVARLAHRLGADRWAATAAALLFGLAPVTVSQGAMAEVYTLAALLLALALHRLAIAAKERSGAELARFALLWGLLLSTHMGASVVSPLVGIAALAMVAGRGAPFGRWAKLAAGSLAAFLATFSLYLYLPVRSRLAPPFDWGDPETPGRFVAHLFNRGNQDRMLALPAEDYLRRFGDYVDLLSSNLGGGLLPLLAVAALLARLVRPRGSSRLLVATLALLWAADAAFVVLLDTAPLASEAYAIPSLVVVALLLALGVPDGSRRAAFAPLLLAVPLLLGARAFPAVDRSADRIVRDEADAILAPLPTGATLVSRTDSRTFPIAWRQLVTRFRPDVTVVDREGNLFARIAPVVAEIPPAQRGGTLREAAAAEIARRLAAGGSVWSTDADLEDLGDRPFRAEPAGAVHPVLPAGANRPRSLCPPPADAFHRRGAEAPLERLDWMTREVLAATAEGEGDTALACGDRAGAVAAWGRAASLSQQAPNHYRLAQRWVRFGDATRAGEAVDRCLALDPGFFAARFLAAGLARGRGDLATAEAQLREVIDRRPDLAAARENLGILLASRGDLAGAERELLEAIRLEPGRSVAWFNLGLARRQGGKPAAAAEAFEKALALEPLSLRARAAAADARGEAGEGEAARGLLLGAPSVASGPMPTAAELDRFCASAFRHGAGERCRALAMELLGRLPDDPALREVAAKAGVRVGRPVGQSAKGSGRDSASSPAGSSNRSPVRQ